MPLSGQQEARPSAYEKEIVPNAEETFCRYAHRTKSPRRSKHRKLARGSPRLPSPPQEQRCPGGLEPGRFPLSVSPKPQSHRTLGSLGSKRYTRLLATIKSIF